MNGGQPKLNIKKVIAVILVFAAIVMGVIGIKKLATKEVSGEEKKVVSGYFAVYTDEKWGVINEKGETIIKPEYDETIIIPDNTRDVFLCTFEVNYENNTYKTKAINSKGEEIITGYDTIQALENYDNNNNLWYESDALLVSKEGKFGLVDFKGKELLKCEYDSIEALKGVKNSFLTKKDEKLGLVDNIGSTIIENNYQAISAISDKYEHGYIVKNSEQKVGVVNRDKTVALDAKYQEIKPIYAEGKYVVKENDKWKIVNTQNDTFLEDKFDEVSAIHGENVILQKDNKYGVMHIDGETKIDLKYQEITHAFEDNYIFKESGQYGVINLSGEVVLQPEYETLIYREDTSFFEGTKLNSIDTEFIGNDFNVKLTGILSEINLSSGYMKVRTNGEYNYYNFKFEQKTNKELLSNNTLFLDRKDGKYGYVNKAGVVVVDYIYDDAREQNEFGYASVKQNGMWGCIDSKGKQVIAPAYKLENNSFIEFINKWHRGEDLNLNYYTDE